MRARLVRGFVMRCANQYPALQLRQSARWCTSAGPPSRRGRGGTLPGKTKEKSVFILQAEHMMSLQGRRYPEAKYLPWTLSATASSSFSATTMNLLMCSAIGWLIEDGTSSRGWFMAAGTQAEVSPVASTSFAYCLLYFSLLYSSLVPGPSLGPPLVRLICTSVYFFHTIKLPTQLKLSRMDNGPSRSSGPSVSLVSPSEPVDVTFILGRRPKTGTPSSAWKPKRICKQIQGYTSYVFEYLSRLQPA